MGTVDEAMAHYTQPLHPKLFGENNQSALNQKTHASLHNAFMYYAYLQTFCHKTNFNAFY